MDLTSLSQQVGATLGVFTLPTAADALGTSVRTVRRLVTRGAFERVCGAGFVVAGAEISAEQRAAAACLTWPDAVVAFRTAAVLHGFGIDDGGETDVLVPNCRASARGLITRHWSVRPVQVERRGDVAMTDRATTAADCLGRLPEAEAWSLLAWLITRELIEIDEVETQLHERHHLYGVVRLRAMVAAVRDGALSMGEVKFHECLREWHVVGWSGDQKVGRRGRTIARVDVLLDDLGVVFEFDGAVAHDESSAARDAARDRALRDELDLIVVHVTWADLYERPVETRRRLREAIAEAEALAAAGLRPRPFLRRTGGLWQPNW